MNIFQVILIAINAVVQYLLNSQATIEMTTGTEGGQNPLENHLFTQKPNIETINTLQKFWTATRYSSEKIKRFRLGLTQLPSQSKKLFAAGGIKTDVRSQGKPAKKVFTNFDARIRWPQCIGEIRNQGQCGSCWAHGATEALSDRLCIAGATNYTNVPLSVQYLVDCDENDSGCDGGQLENAWSFLVRNGVPTEDDYEYQGVQGQCPSNQGLQLYKAKSVVLYNDIPSVQNDITTNGPIEGSFVVYEDFFNYKNGIYVPTTSHIAGYHAIKVLGFGYDSVTRLNYWIAANSWGSDWGEEGFFRIAAGTCQFDNVQSFVGGSV